MYVSEVFLENSLFTVLLLYVTGIMLWSWSLYIHRCKAVVIVLYERRDG